MNAMDDAREAIAKAIKDAELAYEFAPSSYGYHCLMRCRAAYREITRDADVHWVAGRMSR